MTHKGAPTPKKTKPKQTKTKHKKARKRPEKE
jgi:hypothetical protein